jgi:hypothetical protein
MMSCSLFAATAFGAGLGCSSPPDTSPAVSITSPVNMQTLPAGQPIEVFFTVSGIDSTGPMDVPFMLQAGTSKEYGVGRVRAFLDNSNFLAQATGIPNPTAPFYVPDGVNGTASEFVVTGMLRITLELFYNDTSEVEPQRSGMVTVVIQ